MPHVIARELTIDNFKSFGKKTTIPFMEGFTTISGPNGSGKSNLLDSILFALGLSSSKGMRAERLPDLINARSSRREARVTLKLWVPEEDREIQIARAVRQGKDNYSSTYYLDDRVVTLQEIHDVLAELNVSPKGYNIVMQGDVTRLLSMSHTERRKIIDEMAGVAEFDGRIDGARRELDQADLHMDNTRVLFSELIQRLLELENEKKQAQAFLGLREESIRLEKGVFRRRHFDLERLYKTALQRIEKLRDDRKGAFEILREAEERYAGHRNEFKVVDEKVQAITENDRMGGFAELEEVRGNISRAKTYSEYVRSMAEENRVRRDDLGAKATEMETRFQEVGEFCKKAEGEIREIESDLAVRRQEFEKVHDRLQSVSDVSSRGLADLPALRRRAEEVRELVSNMGFEEAKLSQQLLQQDGELKKARDGQSVMQAQTRDLKVQLEERTKDHKIVTDKLGEITYKLFDERSAIKSGKNRLYELEERFRDQYREYTRLEERFRASQGSAGTGALEAVLKSGIKGLHGRVIDLVDIPTEYQVALEAAAGRRLDYVVVSDEHVATEAIEYLKQRKLGRVTFLPLTKVRGRWPHEHPDGLGLIGWAVDLVQFDEKYRGIVAYVLGSTLVIDRIKTGLPFMGRFRMVSLEGDLLETSGAMTGGSAPANRRTALPSSQLMVLKRKLDEIEAEARNLRREIPLQDESLGALEEQIGLLKKQESDGAAVIAQIKRELDRLKVDLAKLEGEISGKETQAAHIKADQQSFRFEIDKGREELAKIEADLGQRESMLNQGSQVSSITEDLRFADGRVREFQEALTKVRDRYKEHLIEREYCQKNAVMFRKEAREVEDKIVTLIDQATVHDSEIVDYKKREAELRVSLESLSKELGLLKEKRDLLATQLEALVGEKEARKAELEKIDREIRDLEIKETEIKVELADLASVLAAKGIALEESPPKESVKELERSLAGVKMKMDEMGAVNLLAIDQYGELENRLGGLKEKLDTLDREKNELLDRMNKFQKQKKDTFMVTFNGVREHFVRIYADLSDGQGELVLENPDDPFAGGLVIKARPRNKKMERMDALSGGEKSLAALGFVFAFQSFRPAPFYIFDEVDMFLDNPNTERLARMIRKQAEDTQFIVVSLKRSMIEKSQQTIGVFAKDGGHTRTAGLEIDDRTQFVTEDGNPGSTAHSGQWN